jgi:hypothetical protein
LNVARIFPPHHNFHLCGLARNYTYKTISPISSLIISPELILGISRITPISRIISRIGINSLVVRIEAAAQLPAHAARHLEEGRDAQTI